jgi:2-polyprenyl-3-methyl-5-hydroxy-6-metoxy-1,4-benzoquinol methylase
LDAKNHWSQIYETKASNQVSWYQDHARLSLDFIHRTGVEKAGQIIDVGGGASTLVDDLVEDGYQHISVLDISSEALNVARQRLGTKASAIQWLVADITQATLPTHFYDIWHDRAVFHFLTQPEARQRYINLVRQSVKVGGHVIVATFAHDGPEKCSGLDVMRYHPEHLHATFGKPFELVNSANETHQTPFGTEQKFIYCYCRMHE